MLFYPEVNFIILKYILLFLYKRKKYSFFIFLKGKIPSLSTQKCYGLFLKKKNSIKLNFRHKFREHGISHKKRL